MSVPASPRRTSDGERRPTTGEALPHRSGAPEAPTEWGLWGPQFALQPVPGSQDADGGWLPLQALVDDPSVLAARIAQTSAALALMGGQATGGGVEVEPRVAASLTQMALVGRVIAAGMGLAVLGHDARALLDGHAWCQPVPGPAYPLAPATTPRPTARGAITLDDTWVDRLATVMAERHQVSPRTLWGNAASVVHATHGIITRATPHLASRADDIAAGLLDTPRIDPAERALTTPFRRHSCCLLHRMAPDHRPPCGDCVLLGRTA